LGLGVGKLDVIEVDFELGLASAVVLTDLVALVTGFDGGFEGGLVAIAQLLNDRVGLP
jgi:hypothetical protein